MNKLLATGIALLALSALQPALAKENYHEKTINADNKEAFEVVATSVRQEMGGGGKYEFVLPKERTQIDAKLDDMTALFDKYGSVSAMTQDSKVQLFNDQEVVNSILTKRDRDRVICTNVAPIGSHIPVTKCHTYAQEVEAREGTKKIMSDWSRPNCVSAPSKSGAPPPQCYMGSGAQ
ncbi:MAG: hypothetical protein ACREPX_14580 [Rhodanobacteraceae bacterium]